MAFEDMIDEEEINELDEARLMSLDFISSKRLYLSKDINKVTKLIDVLSDEYNFMVFKDEFGNYSVVPVHKEYDEMNIGVFEVY